MKQITVHTWNKLTRLFDTLDGWAFRGEREASWDLLSTLSRRLMQFCPDQRLWPEREARGMRMLYRMNLTYSTLFPDLDGLARSIGYELEVMWQPPAGVC